MSNEKLQLTSINELEKDKIKIFLNNLFGLASYNQFVNKLLEYCGKNNKNISDISYTEFNNISDELYRNRKTYSKDEVNKQFKKFLDIIMYNDNNLLINSVFYDNPLKKASETKNKKVLPEKQSI